MSSKELDDNPIPGVEVIIGHPCRGVLQLVRLVGLVRNEQRSSGTIPPL